MTSRGLLLDLDGTLVLSERVHRLTWDRLFDTLGMQVGDDEYRTTFMGRRAGDVLAQVSGPWRPDDVPALVAGMVDHALTLGDAVDVVDGAAGLITTTADAGVPVAVVTSAGPEWAERVLGPVLGVRDRVRVLVTAADVEVGKPSPEGYRLACTRLGVAAADCLGVEDSPSGVRALGAAGVGDVVGITTTSPAGDLVAAGAAWTVSDLADPGLTGWALSPA